MQVLGPIRVMYQCHWIKILIHIFFHSTFQPYLTSKLLKPSTAPVGPPPQLLIVACDQLGLMVFNVSSFL